MRKRNLGSKVHAKVASEELAIEASEKQQLKSFLRFRQTDQECKGDWARSEERICREEISEAEVVIINRFSMEYN